MVSESESRAAQRLLEQAMSLDIRIRQCEVLQGPDAAEFACRIDLEIIRDTEESFSTDDSGALGLLFALACLSFADARARGFSEREYQDIDQFSIADFVDSLTHTIAGELSLYVDYLRGRRMKTRLLAKSDGSLLIETIGRGKSAEHWVARLQGATQLQVISEK
jgi:hypothetical protein